MQINNTARIEGGKRCRVFSKETIGELPLVSIITAVYNGNTTIEETIKSVINQNYPNFEYLVIDGGSTDRTVETLKIYDDAIDYWVSEPDKGVYDALNKGIDLAKGEWLYFLGADDQLFDKNVLQIFFSKPHDTKLVYGNVLRASSGLYDGPSSRWKILYRNLCQQGTFYHRDLFIALEKFDPKYPILADWFFNLRAFAGKNTKPIFIDSIVALYSDAGMSTVNVDNAFFKDREKNIRKLFGLWMLIRFKTYNILTGIMSHVNDLIKR